MDKIKIGQIGMGHNHGLEKMLTVRKFHELFEVVGIAEPDRRWELERGSRDGYADLKRMGIDELLSVKGLNAVLVESDIWDLVPYAQKCIDAGVHIHLDKPAGENIDEYEHLLAEAKRKRLTVQLGYMYRNNPAVRYCIEAVKCGSLGEIFEIDAVMSTQHPLKYRRWLENFKGGDMYIFGSHLIDLAVLIAGVPDKVVPYLKQTNFNGTRCSDNCFALLEYRKATAAIRTTSVEINGYGRRQLVVCGEKGTIEIKPMERPTICTISLDSFSSPYKDRKRTVELPEPEGRYDDMIKDFAGMIRGEIENPYNYDHELAVHRVILKASGLLSNR